MLRTILQKRDFYAGGLMILIGVAVAFDATSYDLGTMSHMGPGMYPLILGVLMTGVGILISGTAILTPHDPDERILPVQKEWRGWGCIVAGPVLFILVGMYFGMAPATFMCVFVAALGDRTATLKSSFVLALGVTVFGVLLFSSLLQLPFPVFRWG